MYKIIRYSTFLSTLAATGRARPARHRYFVQVRRGAGPAASPDDATCEARTELVAPASDRFVADDDPVLEQQFFDITQLSRNLKYRHTAN